MSTLQEAARRLARELRNNATPAEKLLWAKIRKKQVFNLKFLRQHPIFYSNNGKTRFFIADFYCREINLVVEIDGIIHRKQIEYDLNRTQILEARNYFVIRFKNEEITACIDGALLKLKQNIVEITHPLAPPP